MRRGLAGFAIKSIAVETARNKRKSCRSTKAARKR